MRLAALTIASTLVLGACAGEGGRTAFVYDVETGGRLVSADLRAIVVADDVLSPTPTSWRIATADDATASGGRLLPGDPIPTHYKPRNRRIVCAEPSPEAIRAIAEQVGASVRIPTTGTASGPTAGAAFGASQQAAVASIALRTPTIVLLRDALYRVCEGLINGVLDRTHVAFVASRIDDIMFGLHAIDGLTNMPVAAGGSATAQVGQVTVQEGGQLQVAGGTTDATPASPQQGNRVDQHTAPHVSAAVVCIVAMVLDGTGPAQTRNGALVEILGQDVCKNIGKVRGS